MKSVQLNASAVKTSVSVAFGLSVLCGLWVVARRGRQRQLASLTNRIQQQVRHAALI